MKNRIYILYTFISVFALGTAVPTIAMWQRVTTRGGNGARQAARAFGTGRSTTFRFINFRSNRNNSGNGPFNSTNTNYSPHTLRTQLTGNQNTQPRQHPSLMQTRHDATREIRNQFGSGQTNNFVWIGGTPTNVIRFDGAGSDGTGRKYYKGAPLVTAKKPDTTLTGYNPALEKSEENKLKNPILDPERPLPIKREFIKGTRQPSLTNPNITEKTIRLAEERGQTNRLSRVFDKKTRKRLQGKVNNATKDPRERSELRKKINQGVFDMVKNGDDIDPGVIRATVHNKRFWKNRGYEVTFVSHEVAKELREQAREFKNIFNNQTRSSVIRDEKGKIQFAVVTDPEGGFWCFRSGSDDANALVGGEEQNKIEVKKAKVVKNQAQKVTQAQALEKPIVGQTKLTEAEEKVTEFVEKQAKIVRKKLTGNQGQLLSNEQAKLIEVEKGKRKEIKVVKNQATVNDQTKLIEAERKELVKGQAEKVEKGVVAQLEKKNSLIVRPKDKKSLTVAEKTEKSLTVQPEKKKRFDVSRKN